MSALISQPAFWSDDRKINAPELMTKSAATMLARRIESYWRKQGGEVQCWIEMITDAGSERGAAFVVRSNLLNGLPR